MYAFELIDGGFDNNALYLIVMLHVAKIISGGTFYA